MATNGMTCERCGRKVDALHEDHGQQVCLKCVLDANFEHMSVNVGRFRA